MTTERGRYSKVSRRMWNDERFRALSAPEPNAQTLWQRLLTGPELTNIPGCFQAWDAGLAKALRWEPKAFAEAFREVSDQGMAKADWEVGLVWIPNAINHNPPESPNVVRSWRATWELLPECSLKVLAYEELKAFTEGLGEAFAEAFSKACRKPSAMPSGKTSLNQEQEQEQEKNMSSSHSTSPATDSEAETIRKVFAFWQTEYRHPKAKLDRSRRAKIKARLSEGFTGRELCVAIRAAKKDDFLMGRDPKGDGRVYDDIGSLLKNAPKVERLLAIVGAKRGEQIGDELAAKREAEYQERIRAEAAEHHAAAARRAAESDPKTQTTLKAITGSIG